MSIYIQLQAVCEDRKGTEVCLGDEATEFSLYIGKPGSFVCFADYPDYTGALKRGQDLAKEWGIELSDDVVWAPIKDEDLDSGELMYTAAYIVKGFFRNGAPAQSLDTFGGECGLVAALSERAYKVERYYQTKVRRGEECCSVWPYEVCEPLGVWLREFFDVHGGLPPTFILNEKIAELAKECFP